MTTSNSPKAPITPYDAAIELYRDAKWSEDSAVGRVLRRLEARREGYLAAIAHLAPQLAAAKDDTRALAEALRRIAPGGDAAYMACNELPYCQRGAGTILPDHTDDCAVSIAFAALARPGVKALLGEKP